MTIAAGNATETGSFAISVLLISGTIHTGPMFDMARELFAVIAEGLESPDDGHDRLLLPKLLFFG